MIEELPLEEYKEAKAQTIADVRAMCDDAAFMSVVNKVDRLVGGARLRTYIDDCLQRPDAHNLYELLALPRFAAFTKKYLFFPEMVARVVRFAEALPQSTGKGAVCVRLTSVQLFQFCNIYGLYRKNGKRLIREALLFVPRKYGKTTTASTMALYDAFFGEADAEAYITANTFKQSGICFGMVRGIIQTLKKGNKFFREVADTINIYLPGRRTLVRCLPNSPQGLDGLKASLCINDESSQAASFATKNAITTSMGTRANPLTVDITTASDLIEGPFVSQLNNFKQVLLGRVENDSVFAHIFQPDLWDEEDNPDTWRKVHPHIGVTVDVDYYASEYEKALRDYENMVAFKTKLLNVFVCGTTKSWIKSDEIWACFRDWKIDEQDIWGERMLYATCSFDLSIRDDFSAVSYIVRLEDEGTLHSHTDYYFPEGCLDRHPNAELYRRWAEEGYLILTPGDVVDYNYITADILQRTNKIALVAIGYDSYRSGEIVNTLKSAMPGTAKILKAVPQVRSAFTSPTDIMELAVAQKKISFTPNPITAWCFQNAVIDEDNNGNRKPMKQYKSSSQKIDGVITNLMCIKLWEMLEFKAL